MHRLIFFALFFLFLNFSSSAQTTRAYFSRPGLSVGSYHNNFYDGYYNTSWRYAGDTLLCGKSLLVFEYVINTATKHFVDIQDGQVFLVNNPCNPGTLYYDFNLQPGATFKLPTGPVVQVNEVSYKTLINGDLRRYLRLTSQNNNFTTEWLEGIGDIKHGIFPSFADIEGSDEFVCARDSSGSLWENPGESWMCDSLNCAKPFSGFQIYTNLQTISTYNTSVNATHWLWEFGDGQTSNEKHPVHTYAEPGCYEVSLTAYTDCLKTGSKQWKSVAACVDPAWKVQSFSPVRIFDVSFVNRDTGWGISETTILKTTDGGLSWQSQDYPKPPAPVSRVLTRIHMLNAQKGIISCGHLSGSSTEELLVTENGGQTWEERTTDENYLFDVVLTADGQGFACGQYSDLLYSNDGGTSWTTREIPGVFFINKLQYIGNDTLYASGIEGLYHLKPKAAFFKSYDAGITWQSVVLADVPIQNAFHFINSLEGWAEGGPGYMLHTTDGGQTWTRYNFNESNSVLTIQFSRDGKTGWAAGTTGLILHTTDGGQTWKRENCGNQAAIFDLAVIDSTQAYAATNKSQWLKYSPGLNPGCVVSVSTVNATQLRVSPNPATDYISLEAPDLRIGDQVMVVNMLGQTNQSFTLGSQALGLNVSGLEKGCYIALIVRNGQIICRGRFVKVD